MKHTKNIKGLSLIEILIVVTIFAVIGLLSTRSVFLTLKGAKKSDSLIRVRENVNYSLSVIERQIRNAESVTCPNSLSSRLDYISSEGISANFICNISGQDKYIASGSGRLTSSDITITNCSFICSRIDTNSPPHVDILIEAEDNLSQSVEKGRVSIRTQVVLRNY